MFAGLIAATALTLMPVERPEPMALATVQLAELASSINDAVAAIDVQSIEPLKANTLETAQIEGRHQAAE
ncbi:hypothetical protein [Gallaecimonas xiamenensis]|uniref:Uncharacterized protein n=1 Tax=Gallaecimonas xiamenensis 3-C-1 TaxID=745411 RepID=K2J6D4_9GAMM|nr:hypothetical protein [Gallaecimonas xiamenensis]EKE70603.1 hypothetical protein B3C1_13733 [Gallaecimonas xiamenensis 3-C-1]